MQSTKPPWQLRQPADNANDWMSLMQVLTQG
jgi:hypothetical protein